MNGWWVLAWLIKGSFNAIEIMHTLWKCFSLFSFMFILYIFWQNQICIQKENLIKVVQFFSKKYPFVPILDSIQLIEIPTMFQ